MVGSTPPNPISTFIDYHSVGFRSQSEDAVRSLDRTRHGTLSSASAPPRVMVEQPPPAKACLSTNEKHPAAPSKSGLDEQREFSYSWKERSEPSWLTALEHEMTSLMTASPLLVQHDHVSLMLRPDFVCANLTSSLYKTHLDSFERHGHQRHRH